MSSLEPLNNFFFFEIPRSVRYLSFLNTGQIKNLKNNASPNTKIGSNISYFMRFRMKLCQSNMLTCYIQYHCRCGFVPFSIHCMHLLQWCYNAQCREIIGVTQCKLLIVVRAFFLNSCQNFLK